MASLFWIVQLVAVVRHGKGAHWLADLPDGPPPGGWPLLTVVLAARNEAAGVGPAVRSVLAQDYPELSVTVVDDRSTDGTDAVLAAVAADQTHLRVVPVRELPAG